MNIFEGVVIGIIWHIIINNSYCLVSLKIRPNVRHDLLNIYELQYRKQKKKNLIKLD